MICVTCQWLWENLDRPGKKSIRARRLIRRGKIIVSRKKKKKKIVFLRLLAATMDTVLEKMGKLNLVMLLDYRFSRMI